LYNSAYEAITENATDQYLALFAKKTMQFVRAPDENVFIAPFNLIEIFLLILPLEWWVERELYQKINNIIMGIIYFPILLVTAAIETKQAHTVQINRRKRQNDDDTIEEWEQLDLEFSIDEDGWAKLVEDSKPNLDVTKDVTEVLLLKDEVKKLQHLLEKLLENQQEQQQEHLVP